MELIDTDCHLANPELAGCIGDVLRRADEAGVVGCICASADLEESRQAQVLASTHDNVWFIAGVHPHNAQDVTPDYLEELERLVSDGRNVAIGEIGLDYHYNFSPPHRQQEVFAQQLQLACRLGKRVVVHTREAFEDTLAIIAQSGITGEDVLFHSFTHGQTQGQQALRIGAMVSFSGIATFKNAQDVRQFAADAPDDRIMVETDAPYLSPEPVRRMKTNEPANVVHTASAVAMTRGTSPDTFAALTTANARRFFGLK